MLQVGGDLDLGEEAVAADDGGELGVQDLDGDLAAVLQVFGEVDGGHPALAQLALEAIAVGEGGGEAGGRYGHVRLSIGGRFSQRFDVGQVLAAAGRQLVGQKRRTSKEGHLAPAHRHHHPVGPGLVEARHAADSHEHINAVGREADLDHHAGPVKVAATDAKGLQWGTERREGLPHPLGVLRGRVHPHVEILRRTRHTVNGERVRPDDDEAGPGVDQDGQGVEPVVGHALRTTRTGIDPRVYVGWGRPVNSHMRAESSHTKATSSAGGRVPARFSEDAEASCEATTRTGHSLRGRRRADGSCMSAPGPGLEREIYRTRPCFAAILAFSSSRQFSTTMWVGTAPTCAPGCAAAVPRASS